MTIISSQRTAQIDKPTLSAAEKKANIERQEAIKAEEMRLVKGIFKNLECPNGCVVFSQRKFKGETVKTYTMWDGKEYEVPLYVAKYLNNNCAYPVHAFSKDADGNPSKVIGKMINRFAFLSMDYR
jgi:hypothetical protein